MNKIAGNFVSRQVRRANRNGLFALISILTILIIILFADFELIISNLMQPKVDFSKLQEKMTTIEKTEKVYGGSIRDYTMVKNIDKPDVFIDFPYYRFKIKPDSIIKTSAEYGSYSKGVWTPFYRLYIAEYNGIKFGIVDGLGLDVNKPKTLNGIFIKMTSYIKNDMGIDLQKDERFETIDYYFDARNNTYVDLDGLQFFWYRLYIIFVLIIAYFVLKNLFMPKKCFTYDQLTKYGQGEKIAWQIDEEVAEDFSEKVLTTKTWMIEKKMFRTKITKNFRKKTKFDE